MQVNVEALPRTVALERAGERAQVVLLDQRALPYEERFIRTDDWREVVECIQALAVRGAPAIGVAGAGAVALAACEARRETCCSATSFRTRVEDAARVIADARPTAVNLAWAVQRALGVMHRALDEGAVTGAAAGASLGVVSDGASDEAARIGAVADSAAGAGAAADAAADEIARIDAAVDALCDFTLELIDEDEAANRAMGEVGAAVLQERSRQLGRPLRVLTHCNAGSLATAFYGTALGVVYTAAQRGLIERVYADETRPVGQGARLTAWELSRAGVPVTLQCDNMAATLMAEGAIDAVVVGADRIVANGDVANKIGTLGVAVLANHFDVPFYVAAPASTFDSSCATGADIRIEQRDGREVLPRPIEGVQVYNPAFDVTPACLVSAIFTENGVR